MNSLMQEIKIVKLPASKWKEYRKLRLEGLQKDPIAFGSSFEEEKMLSEEEWKRRCKNTIFAVSQDKVVGMIIYNFQQRKKLQHIANMYGAYVSSAFRKQGVGRKLLEAALVEILKNKKIVKISLGVMKEQKAAIALYKKYGFKVVGDFKKDLKVKNKYYDHLVMEKLL